MAIGYKDYLPECSLPPAGDKQSHTVIKCFMCGKEKPLKYGCTKKAYAYKFTYKHQLVYFCSHSCMVAARAKFKPAKSKNKSLPGSV